MKKIYFSLYFFCIALLPASFVLAENLEISVPAAAVGKYKGGEYGDGYWLLFNQGGETLALFSPNMSLKELKGQEGKSMQVQYEYSMLFHPGMRDYVVMKTFKSFTVLPNLTAQQLQALEKKLLADKGPKQALLDVGAYYQYGLRGIKADMAKALEWYEKIAALGIPEALVRAGDLHMVRKGPVFSHSGAHEKYVQAAKAGYTPAFTRLGDTILLTESMSSVPETQKEKEERKQHALIFYTFAAKQKDIDAQARLIAMDIPPITKGFIKPQGPCPDTHLGKATIQGKYVKTTHHSDDSGGYLGFLVQGNDGKSYDIGIGHEEPVEFVDIKAGNTIIIPFYKEQRLDTNTGLCVVKLFHDAQAVKGSYTK